MDKKLQGVLNDKPVNIFFRYSIPSVIGLIAVSSAQTIDAIFLGNFAGAFSLAAINLVFPFFSLIFGFGVMLTTGSSVRSGKYLGEGNKKAASAIFTRTIIILSLICLLITFVGMTFPEELVVLMGANEEVYKESALYLLYISAFTIFFLGSYTLAIFVKVDGRPILSSVGLILGAIVNFILDWWLIAELDMGVKGAALATGLAQVFSLLTLSTHFFSIKRNLRFSIQSGNWKEIWSSCYNGLSELTNELSGGIVILVFNWIIISRMGVSGVAAFTVITYTLGFGIMISYGISESLLPLVSTNFGAKKWDRINSFVGLAATTVISLGVLLFLLLTIFPETVIGVFLESKEVATANIALDFVSFVKWAFLFSGLNMILSAYFTAIHKPKESTFIALSRSLILPISFLSLIPLFIGDQGIYIALPLAEFLTTLLAVSLLVRNLRERNAS